MKNIKKLLALVLALAICAAFALPAFATNAPTSVTNKLTFTDANPNHTYKVYQILAGDVAKGTTGELTLSNIAWGTGVVKDSITVKYPNPQDLVVALNTDKSETGVNSIAKNLIDTLTTDNTKIITLSGEASYEQEVDGGYYLIVDEGLTNGEKPTDPENYVDYVSAYLMQIVGNVDFKIKTTETTSDKDIVANPGADELEYVDSKGYNIGDTVTFSLKANVPADQLNKYENYMLRFNDTMSKGLTFTTGQEMGLNVYHVVTGEDGENTTKIGATTDKIIESTESLGTSIAYQTGDGNTVTVLIPNLFDLINDPIPTEGSILVEVIYTAMLNKDATIYPYGEGEEANKNQATLDFSNNPNSDTDYGTTPPSDVYPYTFEIDGTKVDGQNGGLKLAGAVFQLKDENGSVLEFIKTTVDGKDKYTLYSTNAFPMIPEGAEKVDSISSDTDGKFVFEGLKEGKYTLVEITPPTGYNKLDYDLLIDISATYENGGVVLKHTETEVRDGKPGTPTEAADYVGVTVKNNQGSTLPSTGGIGTTIFYVVGAVLVVGAGVLLFTKRRIKN